MTDKATAPTVTATPAAVSPTPQITSSKKTAAAAKMKKPRVKPSHPPTNEMVYAAIVSLKERHGSSLQAIKKYIAATYKLDAEKHAPFIKKYLKSAVANGVLTQTKGKGASGSFKLASTPKVDTSKKPKTKRAAAKPTTPKKKPAATKKASATKKRAAVKKPVATAAAESVKEKRKAPKAAAVKAPPKPKSPSKTKKAAKAPTTKPKAPKPKKAPATPKTAKATASKKAATPKNK